MKPRSAAEENHFRNISELARFIDASQDSEEIFLHLTRGVCEHSQWDMSSIQILDTEAGLATPIMRYDPFNGNKLPDSPGWDARYSPVGQVINDGRPLVLKDAARQDRFPGFREDARLRGYSTSVMIPLDVQNVEGRPMVYSVASRKIRQVRNVDLSFLQCVADLCDIALRKMRRLEKERQEALRLRAILESMTASISLTLDSEAAGSLASGLSRLFPAGWLAVDLISGQCLFDPASPPPVPMLNVRRAPEELIAAALACRGHVGGAVTDLKIAGGAVRAKAHALQIDGRHVGALFFFNTDELSDHEHVAAQAGQLSLSSFILRNFVECESRHVSARRLLSRLLGRDWRDPTDVHQEARHLDFDLSTPLRLIEIDAPDDVQIDDGIHSFILRTSQAEFGPTISCFLDGALILLVADGDGRAAGRQTRFLSHLRPFLPSRAALVMSDLVNDIERLPKAHETSAASLAVARSLQATGWITPVSVGDFSVLMASAEADKIRTFLDNVIPGALGRPGRKSEIAIETMATFLGTGRRYRETADLLKIHVSTLRYRLERLSHRHDLDFSDPDQCFELELAIRLMNLKKHYET